MVSTKNQKKSFTASTLITLFIVLMLVISGPAQAVSVTISGLETSYTQGSSVNFQVKIEINDIDHFVPITNISLNLTGPENKNRVFGLDGTPLSGDSIIIIVPFSIPENDFGYGYGYGASYGGYGYGYYSDDKRPRGLARIFSKRKKEEEETT